MEYTVRQSSCALSLSICTLMYVQIHMNDFKMISSFRCPFTSLTACLPAASSALSHFSHFIPSSSLETHRFPRHCAMSTKKDGAENMKRHYRAKGSANQQIWWLCTKKRDFHSSIFYCRHRRRLFLIFFLLNVLIVFMRVCMWMRCSEIFWLYNFRQDRR